MSEARYCICCKKSEDEVRFTGKQYSCVECQKDRRRSYLTNKKIEEMRSRGCECGEKKGVLFIISKPLKDHNLEELKAAKLICLNCLVNFNI